MDCLTHEKHEIKCSMNKNDFAVVQKNLHLQDPGCDGHLLRVCEPVRPHLVPVHESVRHLGVPTRVLHPGTVGPPDPQLSHAV